MTLADRLVGGLNDAGRVTDAFRDALASPRADVREVEAREAWNWRPIAIALGGVLLVVVVLRFAVFKR